MEKRINKKVLIPINLIQAIMLILVFLFSGLNLYCNLVITALIGIAGGKIYSTICDFEGKLRHKTAKIN